MCKQPSAEDCRALIGNTIEMSDHRLIILKDLMENNGIIGDPALALFGRFSSDALWASLFIEQQKCIHLEKEA